MTLFPKSNAASNTRLNGNSTTLQVEPLEDRMMLSTVLIGANGSMGGENLQVYIDGEIKVDAILITPEENNFSPNFFSIETEEPVSLSDIRIEFTNDLYLPDQGIDRNLSIGLVVIDDVQQDIDTSSTYSTGTWLPEDGVTTGFGRGTILHTNGFLQFGVESSPTIEFQGNTWTGNQAFNSGQAFVDEVNNELVISGVEGPFSLSREIAIEPATQHTFNLNAYRNVISGGFESDNSPWSTAGINFYDVNGDLVQQETIEINSGFTTPGISQQSTLDLADDITSAFIWIWVDGQDQGTNIPLRVSNISLDAVDTSGDTTPPQAFFKLTQILSSPGNEIDFVVTFTDERRLGSVSGEILVTSPITGFQATAFPLSGGEEFTDTRQDVIYGLRKPDGSDWTEADNGPYTLFLQDNSLVDDAGNVAPGERFFNQLIVDITPGDPDTEPATISFQPPTITERGGIQFIVNTADNSASAAFVDDLRVTSDNGFDVTFGSVTGGFDPEINEAWQLYFFRTDLADGTYTVTLPEGELVDRSGNVTPSQIVGTFVVDLDDSPAV